MRVAPASSTTPPVTGTVQRLRSGFATAATSRMPSALAAIERYSSSPELMRRVARDFTSSAYSAEPGASSPTAQ
jgi:hypothetical protein